MIEFSKSNLKEWEWKIVNEFPDLFIIEPSPTVQEYINAGRVDKDDWINLRYGFEFREGWKEIIRNYLEGVGILLKLLRESGADPEAKVFGCIMKEKFRTLRIQNDVYIKNEYRWLYNLIANKAEQLSEITCEVSGKFKNNHE